MLSKRGISAIVATVLIILITVAAITIIWTAILPTIQIDSSFTETQERVEIITRGGYTFYDPERKTAYVQIKRGAGDKQISKIEIIYSIQGSSETYVIDDPKYFPGPNEMRTIILPLSEKPDSVKVVVYYIQDGKTKKGISSSDTQVESNKAIDPISPGYYTPTKDTEGNIIVDETGNLYLNITDIGNIFIYYDADLNVTEQNGVVTRWTDLTGNSRDMVNGRQVGNRFLHRDFNATGWTEYPGTDIDYAPTKVLNSLNGHATIMFEADYYNIRNVWNVTTQYSQGNYVAWGSPPRWWKAQTGITISDEPNISTNWQPSDAPYSRLQTEVFSPPLNKPETYIFVAKRDSHKLPDEFPSAGYGPPAHSFLLDGFYQDIYADLHRRFYRLATNDAIDHFGAAGGSRLLGPSANQTGWLGTWHIYTVKWDGADTVLRIDGKEYDTAPDISDGAVDRLIMGDRSKGSLRYSEGALDGGFAWFAVFDEGLSAEKIIELENFLSQKYALPLQN